jgi:dienelactone hydrolase
MIELQEEEVSDVIAALAFLKSQPFVHAERIVVSGLVVWRHSDTSRRNVTWGVKALVPFAPGAVSWDINPDISKSTQSSGGEGEGTYFLASSRERL